DNCGEVVLTNSINNTTDASGRYALGTTTVTYTAVDDCGNESSCSFTVMVRDEEHPTMDCPPTITVSCIDLVPAPYANYAEYVKAGGTAQDNKGLFNRSFKLQSETSDGKSCPETITRVYSISDRDRNTAQCSQLIVVNDEIDPVFTFVPADVSVECGAVPDVGEPTASDNCDADVTIVYNGETRTDGDCADSYTLTRTWTATDNCGNSVDATQVITVEDTQAPEFTFVPAAITVECDAVPDVEVPTATDNCDTDVTIVYNGETRTDGDC